MPTGHNQIWNTIWPYNFTYKITLMLKNQLNRLLLTINAAVNQ
ncbi:hypothetical protein J2W55_001051 [Mucilaginibacter pocheonensis]|uniref:Uncharacterized protein n=1 Tax=Mucilaginibacter pocheonensis TaxID=398050 RepID=A0ABU1T741_9SPHI|nr:hypothetical protein [Mucilaginibacter pocheonensis]